MKIEELLLINSGQSRRDRDDWKVEISDVNITSITVKLENTVERIYWRALWYAKVELRTIEYCVWEEDAGFGVNRRLAASQEDFDSDLYYIEVVKSEDNHVEVMDDKLQ